MKAIVCDKCGKVTLLPDVGYEYGPPNGVFRLYDAGSGNVELDLCQECVDELMAAVRKE